MLKFETEVSQKFRLYQQLLNRDEQSFTLLSFKIGVIFNVIERRYGL